MTDDTIKNAIALIRAGQKLAARKILEPFIMANPHNIQAWLWEAETRETISGKIKILEMCLQQNPNDPQVTRALAALISRQGQLVSSNTQDSISHEVPTRQSLPENITRSTKPTLNQNIPPRLKSCPYCAEMIQEYAKICRFCGRNLPQSVQSSLSTKVRWIIVGLIPLVAVIIFMVGIVISALFNANKARNVPGSLEGTVAWRTVGAGNVFVVGVTVKVWQNGHEIQRTITDSDGKYEIKDLPPGTYTVSVYQPASSYGDQIAEKCWVFRNMVIQPEKSTKLYLDFDNQSNYIDPLCDQGSEPPVGDSG